MHRQFTVLLAAVAALALATGVSAAKPTPPPSPKPVVVEIPVTTIAIPPTPADAATEVALVAAGPFTFYGRCARVMQNSIPVPQVSVRMHVDGMDFAFQPGSSYLPARGSEDYRFLYITQQQYGDPFAMGQNVLSVLAFNSTTTAQLTGTIWDGFRLQGETCQFGGNIIVKQ